jgi:hypothetical protein
MRTFIVALLVALAPIILVMVALRQILFFSIVVPKVQGKGIRFWINTVGGGTQSKHIKSYLESLPRDRRAQWPNWYLAKANLMILVLVAAWVALLLVSR